MDFMDYVTVQDIFTSSPLSRVLGSEDAEDAEVVAARPFVPRESSDT